MFKLLRYLQGLETPAIEPARADSDNRNWGPEQPLRRDNSDHRECQRARTTVTLTRRQAQVWVGRRQGSANPSPGHRASDNDRAWQARR